MILQVFEDVRWKLAEQNLTFQSTKDFKCFQVHIPLPEVTIAR